jgi:hypothetical protein
VVVAMAEAAPRKRMHTIGFGALDLLSALLVYLGVFEGLPTRYWLVDTLAALALLALLAGGVGLLSNARWGPWAARMGAAVALAIGLALVGVTAISVSYLSGIYGPVGRGGALILTLVAALALPYLVVLPAAQLAWLGPWRRADSV